VHSFATLFVRALASMSDWYTRALSQSVTGEIEMCRTRCNECGRLATRKQVSRIGIRLTSERIGVCNGSPEPIWAAEVVARQERERAEQARQAIEEDRRQRAAALAGAAAAASDVESTSSKACVVS
jgi:hypothetical protein